MLWTTGIGRANNNSGMPRRSAGGSGPTRGDRRMARRRSASERKRRTREHVLADLSANYVEKQALLCGFAVERVRLDYGIDLMVQTFNRRGEVENGWIPFQLKGTDRIKFVDGGSAVSCRIERADLRHWLKESQPVILTLYDARTDVAYWLFVKGYFEVLSGFDLARCGKRVTVSIPSSNVLDRGAMRNLARLKNELAARDREKILHAL
jgi:hypothetical protein